MSEQKAGRYELLEELGRGAMGVVWKGHDPTIGRTVAVKTMKLTEEGTGLSRQDLLNRFQNETRAAGLLTHPNIVVVYDAGADEGSSLFYITMEYIQGQSLQALLDKKQVFPISRIMKLMEQCCGALGYAHDHKVVHRDVKPANIMIMPDDTVKVTDFGTAKILQLGTTMTGQIVGTPSYMSPEQVKGRSVDGRSDIFALGVILYELVTGEKPFPGQNVTTVIYKIVHEDPISPIELDSSVHPGLNQVISKTLAKDPDDRYQTCRELFEDMRNYRDLGPAREMGSTVVMVGRPREMIEATQPVPPSRKPAEIRPGTLSGVPVPPATAQASPQAPAARAPSPGVKAPPAEPPAATPPPSPRASKTLPPLPYSPPVKPEKKSSAGVWLALLALVVLGAGGYLLWPNIQPLIGSLPGSNKPPQSAAETPSEPVPPPAGTGLAAKKETPAVGAPEVKPAETKPAESRLARPEVKPEAKPKGDALALQKSIEQRLARAGFAGKVRVDVNGKTVTLTGTLKAAEHRRAVQQVRPLPAGIRLEDRIEVASAGSADGEDKPRTAPGLGEVEVVTDVMGAKAVLTGPRGNTSECKTPCRFEELEPGRYTMEVTHPSYRPVKRIVQVQAGHIKNEQLTFQPYSSGIYVVTRPPKADVYVNGQRYGEQTPTTIQLAPGKHSIKVQKTGFQDYQETVELSGDSLKQLSVSLVESRKGVGLVDVKTVPPGADIIVNGTNTGRRTPFVMELPAGEYNVTLYLKPRPAVQKKVVVQTDKTISINEVLPK